MRRVIGQNPHEENIFVKYSFIIRRHSARKGLRAVNYVGCVRVNEFFYLRHIEFMKNFSDLFGFLHYLGVVIHVTPYFRFFLDNFHVGFVDDFLKYRIGITEGVDLIHFDVFDDFYKAFFYRTRGMKMPGIA